MQFMSANKDKYLIVIAGPTAVGKTNIAIGVAKHFEAEIFSCDSRQIFDEMNIGTAKPSGEELAEVSHHFVGSRSVAADYTTGDYEREVDLALAKYFKGKDIAILTGGTGLYIKAVLEGLDQFPDVPDHILRKLDEDLAEKGIENLVEQLRKVDPSSASKMDLANSRRLIRALSVCYASGLPYSSFLTDKKKELNFTPILIGLDLPREKLYERINQRVEKMLDDGLEAEVKALLPYREKKSLQTVGYKELFAYFDGEISRPEAIELIKRNSRRYAKRQITWFKNQGNFHLLKPNFDLVLSYIQSQMS